MNIHLVKLESLTSLDNNPRKHPRVQIEELKRSYQMFGQTRPVIVDEEGIILAGNGFYSAMKELGVPEISVHRMVGLSKSQKTKLAIADNKTFELGSTDQDILFQLLGDLKLEGDLDIPGYNIDILNSILITEDDADEIEKRLTEYGTVAAEDEKTIVSKGMVENIDDSEDTITVTNKDIMVEDDKGMKRPYISCPKCGERIWL